MTAQPDAAGMAALTICESLLAALREARMLDDEEIDGVLEDAAATHLRAAAKAEDPGPQNVAAALIHRMLTRERSGGPISRTAGTKPG